MKLSLKNLKSALDYSTERRTVDDLVRSGTRSVRVISESQVVRLIEAIVEDTLAESGHVDPAERDRVVAAAKARFDNVMQQQAETEARNKRQEETILSFQQRITQLVNEKQQAVAAQRLLEQKLDAALRGVAPISVQPIAAAPVDSKTPEELARLAEGLAQLQQKLDGALRNAAPVVVQPAAVAADDRTPEGLARLAEGLASLQQHLSRLESKGSNTAADLDSRMEQSMQRLIDRFGRTVSNATAKPTETRVEATDALIGRMLDGDAGTMSNIGDLDVQERRAEGDIQKSLERLRRAQKGSAAPAPDVSKDQTATDDRRDGPPDRRTDPPASNEAKAEWRKGPKDRRSR